MKGRRGGEEERRGRDDTQLRFERSMRLMVFFVFYEYVYGDGDGDEASMGNAIMSYGGYDSTR